MSDKKILTEDFITIRIPELIGTKKQILFGEKIRQKYINIFNNKLSKYGILDLKGRKYFTKQFVQYINNDQTNKASYWINNHCAFCGCVLIHEKSKSKCSNSFCKFVKEN